MDNLSLNAKIILSQEAAGGSDLLNSSKLPKDGDWEILKGWGIQVVGESDDLFFDVILPKGWTKICDNSDPRHMKLVDNQGLIRAYIFYKSSFYDRKASISVVSQRYVVSRDYNTITRNAFVVRDLGLDKILQSFKAGSFAYLTSNPSVVGLVLHGIFYFCAKEVDDIFWGAVFTENTLAELATLITDKEFFDVYHSGEVCNYPVIDAAKNQSEQDAIALLATLPQGEAAWS